MVPDSPAELGQQVEMPLQHTVADAVAAPMVHIGQQQQEHEPVQEQISDVKVHALEALNSAFFKHIYSSALGYLQQNYSYDAVTQQFMDILDQDDPYESPCTIAHQEGNSSKNRYRDVVPYDHNRVTLPALPSSSSSSAAGKGSESGSGAATSVDTSSSSSGCSGAKVPGTYINASFMSDPQSPGDASQVLGYIATQGPLPSTVADLWRMVAVTNTSAIVMLTSLTDGCSSLGNSRPRCAPYFPENEQDCLRLPGNITVTCVHKNSLDENVSFRQLEVVWGAAPPQQGVTAAAQPAAPLQQRLWINHYQYIGWPDYGIPSNSSSVRVLCHALDGCRRAGCKIVVHCSAGIGRTGTFIAIDMLLQRLHSLTLQLHGSVRHEDIRAAMDIPSLIASLRQQRRGTVQTAEQYGFVWQALMDELQVLLQELQELEQTPVQLAGQQVAMQQLAGQVG